MPGGKCVFNRQWLDHKSYKNWVEADDKNRHKAFCKACKKSIDVSAMGESALLSHSNGKKHADLIKLMKSSCHAVPITGFLTPGSAEQRREQQQPASERSTTSTQPSTSTTAMTEFCANASDVLRAEILWTLKVVNSHYSFHSCNNNSFLFREMFPDSKIAENYKCGETKTAYLVSFGIGLYLQQLVKKMVKDESAYVLLFDESLNESLQKKQLDIHVRLWIEGKVITKYLTSEFLGHATAADLFERLDSTVTELGYRKLLQLSMDGPNVNWKVYETIQLEIEKMSACKLLQTGSCGLHIMHNAFRQGCSASGWNLHDFLSRLFTLLDNCPARRDDYTSVTGSTTFPLQFCSHRWLENTAPAERAILILPSVIEYCTAARFKKVSLPTCSSFSVVQKAIQDPLLTAKLQFFNMIAREIEPFLTVYQTDKPMLPFIAGDLALLLKGLMEKFIKPEVMKEATSVTALAKLDVSSVKNHIEIGKVDVGFMAQWQLSLRQIASEKQKLEFREGCRNFLQGLTKKLLEKAPITYPIVRLLSWLDPRQMAQDKEQDNNKRKLRRILHILSECGRVQENLCDNIISQYSQFLNTVVSEEEFLHFDPKENHIDNFLHSRLAKESRFQDLWIVIRQLLILSHGQATVERGFSLNRNLLCENMQEPCIIGRRQILDYCQGLGGVEKVQITKELLLAASSARQKYQYYMDEKKKAVAAEKVSKKMESALQEISDLKAKKARFEEDIEHLRKRADKLSDDAERHGALTLLTEANALRRKAKDRGANVEILTKEIGQKMEDLKSSL